MHFFQTISQVIDQRDSLAGKIGTGVKIRSCREGSTRGGAAHPTDSGKLRLSGEIAHPMRAELV